MYRRNWKRYRDIEDHRQMTRLNKSITKEIAEFRNQSWNNMLSSLDKSSPPFWKIAKMLRKKSKIIPILKQNNIAFFTQQEKCEILAESFKSNHSISAHLSDTTTISEVITAVNEIQNTIPRPDTSYFINHRKTSEIINKLKNKKSPGLDDINNKCLKNLPNKAIIYLTSIFNACLKFVIFPTHGKYLKQYQYLNQISLQTLHYLIDL